MDEQDSNDLGKEIAKASQEKWKAIQKGLDLTDRAADFLGRVFGDSADNIGGILSDQTKHWRAKNLDRIAFYWQERIGERDISEDALEQLPFGDAFRVIEAASMEDDEDVQRMWADLIANATDPDKSTQIKKVYIDLLKSLSSPEVILLNLLWSAEKTSVFKTREELEVFNKETNALAEAAWRKLDKSTRDTAIQNLIRLRCLSFRPKPPAVGQLFNVPRQVDAPWPSGYGLVNAQEFQKLMLYYEEVVLIASGIKDFRAAGEIPLQSGFGGIRGMNRMAIKVPEMNYMLTPMAKDLLGACEDDAKEDKENRAVA